MKDIIPSSAVILLKPSKGALEAFNVLLLRRNQCLATHGGSWVFPGGKLDASDFCERESLGSESVSQCLARYPDEAQLDIAKKAAVRELQEEAGITIAAKSLDFCSRWLTPDSMQKRFDAYFFIAISPTDTVKIDGQEIHDSIWVTPESALEKHRAGEWVFPPSTFVTLSRLAEFADANTAKTSLAAEAFYYRPRLATYGNGVASLYQDDAGYETRNPLVSGLKHRLIMAEGQFEYIKQSANAH